MSPLVSSGQLPSFETVRSFAARHQTSIRTVERWIAKGLPCHRVGRMVRLPSVTADRWLTPKERRMDQETFALQNVVTLQFHTKDTAAPWSPSAADAETFPVYRDAVEACLALQPSGNDIQIVQAAA